MKIKTIFTCILIFIPLIITLIVLPTLSDTIPVHFGFGGNVTRFGSRYEVLIIPVITIILGVFLILYGRKTHKNNVLLWVTIGITLIFLSIQIWFLHLAYTQAETIFNDNFDIIQIISVLIGISCIIIGNVMPKLKQNYIVGIRTSWTLKSEVTWHKTHRLGGKILVAFGIAYLLLTLFVLEGSMSLFVFLLGFLLIAIILIIYSYHIYKQESITN